MRPLHRYLQRRRDWLVWLLRPDAHLPQADYVGPVDALADELLVAVRDADPSVLGPHTDPRLLAAYNRLYCELHDKGDS